MASSSADLGSPPDPAVPSETELRAYCRGTLPMEHFRTIERWLDSQPEATVERLLTAAAADEDLRKLTQLIAPEESTGFMADTPRGRVIAQRVIGEGGMAEVSSARDRALDRVVALKVLKPRRHGESLAEFQFRESAFRREAALTAALEHPAIVPVYDVGRASGLPAFTMKRVEGQTLDALVEEGQRPLSALIEALLRVAEAVAYAHSRGVVHRDLKPRNVLIGEFGAVYVLDWGIAARTGNEAGISVGTPGWMSPEQHAAAAADPRMDVYALGGLVFYVLTRRVPTSGNDPTDQRVHLELLADRHIPRGLAALARRCLERDPDNRYTDAQAVAADLRRWLDEGLTFAQEASRMERAWHRFRRSPHAVTGVFAGAIATAVLVAGFATMAWRARDAAERRLVELEQTIPIDRPEPITIALTEIHALRTQFPGLAMAQSIEARFQAALDISERQERTQQIRSTLDELLRRARVHGTWSDQIQSWQEALARAGISLDGKNPNEAVEHLRDDPLRDLIIESLPFLWRAEKERGLNQDADHTAILLTNAGPSDGWRALGRILQMSHFSAHDPIFCPCDDSTKVLSDPESASVALAIFGPEARLIAYAKTTLESHPGEFWPLIATARAALSSGDFHEAEHNAMIASGAEPGSLLPQLLLGYVYLERNELTSALGHVDRGLAVDPGCLELLALNGAVLAKLGRHEEAQAMANRIPAAHLQYHLQHRVGHPMERSVEIMVDNGVIIPAAEPSIIPELPHHHQ